MSRRKLKTRNRVTQKMSHDGLTQRNETTGESTSISKRGVAVDLNRKSERAAYSQLGNRSGIKHGKHKKRPHRQTEPSQPQNHETAVDVHTAPESFFFAADTQIATESFPGVADTPAVPVSSDCAENIQSPPPDMPINRHHNPQRQGRDSGNLTNKDNSLLKQETETAAFQHGQPKPDTAPRPSLSETAAPESAEQHEPPAPDSRLKHEERSTLSQVGNRPNGDYRHNKSVFLRHGKERAVHHDDKRGTPQKPGGREATTKHDTVIHSQASETDKLTIQPDATKSVLPPKSEPATERREPEPITVTNAPKPPPVNILNPLLTPHGKAAFREKPGGAFHHQSEHTSEYSLTPPETLKTAPPPDREQESSLRHEAEPIKAESSESSLSAIHGKADRREPTPPKPDIAAGKGDTPEKSEAIPIHEKAAKKPGAVPVPKESREKPEPLPFQEEAVIQPDIPVTAEPPTSEPQTAEWPAPPPDNAETADTPKADEKPPPDSKPETPPERDNHGKLKFTEDEAAPTASDTSKLEKPKSPTLTKAEKQSEQANAKLEKARDKLPKKHKLRSERVFDETKGKAKRRLYFETEAKTQGEHLKGTLPLRPVKVVGNALALKAHSKVYQVEHENVGVKATHRAELLSEGGVRAALRFRKTAPYKKVTRLEKQVAKKTIKLNYQKTLDEHPNLSGNIFSRMAQKRKIKKDYAKKAREAQKAAQTIKKAGSLTAKAVQAVASVIARHPAVAAVIVVIALLLFMFMSLFGLASGVGSGGLGTILTASYLAEDEDIESAELSYSEWETDLQYQLANLETDRPGYDEYIYNTGEISHNPYELMAYLTAVYQCFPYEDISTDLRALFDEQYSLSFTETTETRYADPTDENGDGDLEPYEWKILTVSLLSRSFNDVIIPKMTADQREHYEILMQTRGSRQYAANPFATGWLPYVTSYYGWRVHPITGEKDLHRGTDIAFPAGTEIHSAQDGTVTFAGVSGSYGNVVIIENDKGLVTKYAHCETLLVSAGQTVTAGDVIATVGSTGDSTGAHLHMEVLKDGQYMNPLYYIDAGSYDPSPVYGTPGAAMGDGSYAALIAEAESHLGKPYVFGANGTNSFDCSSYICYILTQSGVRNMPRTTAQGIFNQCTPISESEARPGDIITFQGTYSTTNTVTHIGLYAGVIDGHPTMIHAGSPIQYTRIDTAYWQDHFYSYARVN